jgi:hypothetical protein
MIVQLLALHLIVKNKQFTIICISNPSVGSILIQSEESGAIFRRISHNKDLEKI